MFIIFYLVKLLLAKITKLWILSFYIQNNTFIYVWNKKNFQFFMSVYIFWSLNTRLKKKCIIPKATAFNFWKKVVNMESYIHVVCLIQIDNIFASQGFRSRSPLSSPLADWARISDPRALDFYWMQLLQAASNQIAANNRSRKHHVYAVEN